MAEMTFLQVVNQTLAEEMARDPTVFLIGEDLRIWGAPRGEYKGLFEKFGAKRVLDTPISETAILGGAIGAAATGLRPIASIMYANFIGVCGDELLNQLTQMRYMFGESVKLPVTIMSYFGAGFSAGAHHSKSVHGILMGIPGLKIVVPSTPYDAKGLLKSAIREDNPTIFLSHQMLMRRTLKSDIPDEEYTIPLGQADIKREGTDVTVKAAILDSVKKTNRLVVMEEEPLTGGAAAEIAAIVAEEAFDYLDAPIKRVCAPDTPVPFSPVLEKRWMPDEDDLIRAIRDIL